MVNLTIGAGSFKGFAFLGALEYLDKKKYLTCLENFYGCSIGAIIGFLYIIGYKPINILNKLIDINFSKLWNIDFKNINSKLELIDIDIIFNLLIHVFLKNDEDKLSLKEFNDKYLVKFNVYAVNLNTRKLETINEENYSDINIIEILKASAAIPLIFRPIKIKNNLFIDGSSKIEKFCINNSGYILLIDHSYNNIENYSDYIHEVLNTLTFNTEFKHRINTLLINLDIDIRKEFNFGIDNNMKFKLYLEGLKQAKKHYCNI